MRRLLCVAVLAGCYNPAAFQPCNTVCQNDEGCQPGFVCGTDGMCRGADSVDCSAIDAGADGPTPDMPPGTICLGKGFIKNVCFQPDTMPTNDIDAPVVFDTASNCSMMMITAQPNHPPICALVGRSFLLPTGRTMRVTGPYPLAIITTMQMTIAGTIDVSSSLLAGRGTGSGPTGPTICSVAAIGQSAVGSMEGGGGGAGGALTTQGGRGGAGAGGHEGGGVTATKIVAGVRGGCDGARGGNNALAGAGGVPGFGGGAVYLITGTTLAITGMINASGAGGGSPLERAGGGGGGSGGFIGLDAAVFGIAPGAVLFASGGSGASGGGNSSDGAEGGIAAPGNDPTFTTGADGGGIGGNGSSLAAGGMGEDTQTTAAGGGGGGGAGYIGYAGPYDTNLTTTTVRPRAVAMP